MACRLQEVRCLGWVVVGHDLVPWHVESSQTRDWTRVSCIGTWVLNHGTSRRVLSAEDFYLPTYLKSIFVYLMERSRNSWLKIHLLILTSGSSVQLVSIPYIFFWNWLSFVCACWIVFDCILEFWILCCEILDHIEILCRRLILFVCLTGSSLGWFQTAGPISLTVGIVPGSVNLQASAVLLWGCPIVPSPGVSHSPHSGCERAGSYPEQGISFLS